ncbi:hypothetical protein RFI_14760, partial [Reticulomyxa filosa]
DKDKDKDKDNDKNQNPKKLLMRGTYSNPRSSINHVKKQEVELSVMQNLHVIQKGVHVEVMEDSKIPDAWVCGVVSTRQDQTVFVTISGNAPVIIPKGTQLGEDGTVIGRPNENLEPFEVLQKKELSKQTRDLVLDLTSDAYRIRLQLFGVDPQHLECKPCRGYEVDLPSILLELKDKLFKLEGHTEEGVFRITPSTQQIEEYRHAICQGKLNDYNYTRPLFDIHILSCLIKVWFREVPKPILNSLGDANAILSLLHDKLDVDTIADISSQLPPLSRALLFWLFDLCIDVCTPFFYQLSFFFFFFFFLYNTQCWPNHA